MLQSNASAVPLTVEVDVLRLLQLTAAFTALVGSSMYALHGSGLQVDEYYTMTDSYEEQAAQREHWNTISGYAVTAVLMPLGWFVSIMLSVGFLAFTPSQHMRTKQTIYSIIMFTTLSVAVKSLVDVGFNAAFAKIKQKDLQLNVYGSDLVVDTDDLDIMLTNTTTLDNLIAETTENNYITNTVLRNVLAPIVLQADLVCNGTHGITGDSADTSQFATGLLQSYGFPLRTWQSNMLPINYGEYSDAIALNGSESSDWMAFDLPMDADTAANVFIHAMHVSRYFFRWFTDYPFNVTSTIQESTDPDYVDDASDAPIHSVSAAVLLGLLPSDSNATDQDKAEWFLEAATTQYKASLSGGINISQDESTMEFSHVDISDTITFDSVTIEVPLRKNFYYRKLILDEDSDTLQEDTTATATYSSVDYASNSSDIYYDLDIAADCGPDPGLCVMPRVQEYDVYGSKYQPDPQIKATAVCLNSNGSEDFQIDYDHYIVSSNSSETLADAYWACSSRSSTSMWIVSLGSRIVGDAMYEGRAPNSTETSLDANRATLVNPRKIYTLTVGRLAWEIIDIAKEYGAYCDSDSCLGLEYFLDQTTDGSFDYSGATNASSTTETDQYILVSESSVPSTSLRAFQYIETEDDSTYSGFGSATRWVPLMSLVTPMGDEYYTLKGNVIFPYNFDSFSWTSGTRSGTDCSDASEDHLNHVVRNHYYMEHGLQPSYTAGMYFLFQNGVVRNVMQVNDTMSTLVFDGNIKVMGVYMSTPKSSMLLTICGISILLLCAIVAIISSWWLKPGMSRSHEVTVAMVADMMLNDVKYPEMMLYRRIENPVFADGQRFPLDQFQIEQIVLRHQGRDISFTLPLRSETMSEDELTMLKSARPASSIFYVMEKDKKTPSDGAFFV